jgi:hypothetical protein
LPRADAIAPMTLANMRANGVRSLLVYCCACPRMVVFNVDGYPESVPVPAFGPRMVCTGCGMIGADARPNWRERYDPGQITRSLKPGTSYSARAAESRLCAVGGAPACSLALVAG